MNIVRRIYVEKREPYAVRAKEFKDELERFLGINGVKSVRVLNRYTIENISDDTYRDALTTVFMDSPVEILHEETFEHKAEDKIFSVEYLPGQFDQRADSAEKCIKLISENEDPIIHCATTYILSGDISDEDFKK